MIDLIIEQGGNDIILSFESSVQLQQRYGILESAVLHRMMDGTGVKQYHWSKRTTSISGSGHLPDSLSMVDWSAQMTILCVRADSKESVANVIALPSFRDDAAVTGFAFVNGRPIATPVDVVGSTATLTAVVGATRYKVVFYPKITGWGVLSDQSGDYHESDFSWSFELEEA